LHSVPWQHKLWRPASNFSRGPKHLCQSCVEATQIPGEKRQTGGFHQFWTGLQESLPNRHLAQTTSSLKSEFLSHKMISTGKYLSQKSRFQGEGKAKDDEANYCGEISSIAALLMRTAF